jgi:hypothetical protein
VDVGKTLFAQIIEFIPWTSFARIVQRYDGNSGVRALSVSIFEKTEISCALQADDTAINLPTSDNQLNLFNI